MTREQEEEDSAPLPPNYGLTLHTLVLAPRAAHRNYGAWMRDCLVKQGLEVGAAEALVQGIATKVNSSRAEVGLMRSYLAGLEARADPTLHSADLALLDCMMARIHISLDRVLSTGALPSPTSSPGRGDWEAGDTPELSLQAAHTLVPAVARLLTQLGTMARAHVLQAFTSSCDMEVDAASRSSLLHAISLAGTRCPATASLALPITAHLPPQLRAALEDWAATSLTSFPPPRPGAPPTRLTPPSPSPWRHTPPSWPPAQGRSLPPPSSTRFSPPPGSPVTCCSGAPTPRRSSSAS